MKKILAKILERMGNWFNSPNPLFEFDIYKQGNKLLLFVSFLRFGKVLTLCHPEEKEDVGVLRQWDDELCPYDFPTKEEKEEAQSLSKVESEVEDWFWEGYNKEEKKEPDSYDGIYYSEVSGRMFEAKLSENGEVYFIDYCDDLPNDIGSISRAGFALQVEVLEYYQQVFSYLEIERGIE